jgi:hypothetical protein
MGRRNRKMMSIAAVVVVLAACGVGIAQAAVGGGADEQATGPQAERAEQAALKVAGAGHVAGVERSDGGWKVKVVKRGESLGPWWDESTSDREVEIRLDRNYQWVSARSAAD